MAGLVTEPSAQSLAPELLPLCHVLGLSGCLLSDLALRGAPKCFVWGKETCKVGRRNSILGELHGEQ